MVVLQQSCSPFSPATPSVDDAVVVRIAALPVTALDELRCAGTWHAVQTIIEEQDAVTAEGRDLALALEPLIGAAGPGEVKCRLVALRRALYNARPRPVAARPAGLLGAELDGRLRAWLDRSRRCDRLLAELPALLAEERRVRRENLRRWAATDAFAHGLVQASPALSAALRQWLDSPPGTAPTRQVELRLSRYLARVVAKTSPHSTFTMTGLGYWGPGPEPVVRQGRWTWRTAVEPNLWLLRRLLGDLAEADGGLRDLFSVQPNASLTQDGDRLWYLSRTEDEYRSVRAAEPVLVLLRELNGGEPHSLADVGRLVAGDPARAGALLARLADLDLIEVHPPSADQSRSHLRELAEKLATHPAGAVLAEIERALARYPGVSGLAARLGVHRQVRAALDQLHRPVPHPGMPRLPGKNLFHDNAVFSSPTTYLGRRAWRAAIGDLHVIREFLGLFQRDTEIRLLAAHVFRDAFGTGAQVPFGRFHRTLAHLLEDRAEGSPADELHALLYRGRATGPGAVAEVRELRRYREDVLAMVRAWPVSPDGSIRLDPAMLPRAATPVRSLACYVQPLNDDGPVRLVLNSVAAGHGAARGRVRRLLDVAGLPVEDAQRERAEAGGIPAEIAGFFGHNVNLRADTTAYEIDYPGVLSNRPAAYRLALRDLAVRPDPATGLLELVRAADGGRVRPRHTGMIAAPFLPRTARLLFHLFGDQPSVAVPTWALFAEPPRRTSEAVTRAPRVTVGHVVVARAAWYAAARSVPRRAPGASEAGHLLDLARWFAAHGIPPRCFVFSLDPGTWGEDPWRTARLAKPTYLDLADPALVALLDRQLDDCGACVVFQECLPDLPAAAAFDGGRHVMEYVVELRDG
ncbi:hypothetical protein AB0I81_01825 [Nonomuraea sp. NPDC050404]|uniref:hypothetical protein n=1 Tax=Nonomuraea sp. NPDC050404 TaxID=3155783 RepID=UPI0033EE628C